MSPWPDHPVGVDAPPPHDARQEAVIGLQRLHEFQADLTAARLREVEVEKLLMAAPAETWPETAAKTRSLVELFARTPEARDPRVQELIASALDDLARLCDQGLPNRPVTGS